jgi:eukaryotic-like serine/threonine-protein kinase
MALGCGDPGPSDYGRSRLVGSARATAASGDAPGSCTHHVSWPGALSIVIPDGNYVAFMWTGPKQDNADIYVQQIGAGSPLHLTSDPRSDQNPVWSPNGRWIAFLRGSPSASKVLEAGRAELRLIPPLGGPERKVTDVEVRWFTPVAPALISWCPESDCLIVTDSQGEGKPVALFVVALDTGS